MGEGTSKSASRPSELRADEAARLASTFRIAIMRLARRISAERSDDMPRLSGLSALSTLSRSGPLCTTDFAELERVQPPSITRRVNALEERGLVVRAQHPSDRRRRMIAITDAGRSLLDEEHERDAWLTRRMQRLPADERRRIAEAVPILRRLGESD